MWGDGNIISFTKGNLSVVDRLLHDPRVDPSAEENLAIRLARFRDRQNPTFRRSRIEWFVYTFVDR